MYGLTIGESKKMLLKLIDEYSINGALVAEGDNLDYLRRHNAFADFVQSSLAQLFPIAAVHTIRQQPLQPLLAAGGFSHWPKASGQDLSLTAEAAGAYYCELAGPVTLYVEERVHSLWYPLAMIEHSEAASRAYKGNLTGQDASFAKRLRFSSDYPGYVENAALFRSGFAADAQVPDCKPWRRYLMPENFWRLSELVLEEQAYYGSEGLYHWQNERTLVLPHDLSAQVEVRYWAYPPRIDDDTPDDYVYPLAPEVARLIPLKVAALVIPTERADLSLRLLQLYEQELSRLQTQGLPGHRQVQSVFCLDGGA